MRDGFRTNIGLFNATVQPSNVLVRIHTGGGNAVAEKTYSLPGLGWQQLNDVFAELGTPAIRNAYVEVVQLTGDRLAVYSSVVDNTSGDPTTFMAKTAYTGQQQLWVPAAARLTGFNGTKWVTDVNYLNLGPTRAASAALTSYPYNHDNSGGGRSARAGSWATASSAPSKTCSSTSSVSMASRAASGKPPSTRTSSGPARSTTAAPQARTARSTRASSATQTRSRGTSKASSSA